MCQKSESSNSASQKTGSRGGLHANEVGTDPLGESISQNKNAHEEGTLDALRSFAGKGLGQLSYLGQERLSTVINARSVTNLVPGMSLMLPREAL